VDRGRGRDRRRVLPGPARRHRGDRRGRGKPRPCPRQLRLTCPAADPAHPAHIIFTADGTLNREDWGLTWNMPLDGGGLLVSKEIRIEAEAVLQP
jgi:polyisoprenoid-binding protein YceI